jgi:hypothetical protein
MAMSQPVPGGDWLQIGIEAFTLITPLPDSHEVAEKADAFVAMVLQEIDSPEATFEGARASAHPLRVQKTDKTSAESSPGADSASMLRMHNVGTTLEFMVNARTSKIVAPALRFGVFVGQGPKQLLAAEGILPLDNADAASKGPIKVDLLASDGAKSACAALSGASVLSASIKLSYWARVAEPAQAAAAVVASGNAKARARSRAAARVAAAAAKAAINFAEKAAADAESSQKRRKASIEEAPERERHKRKARHKAPTRQATIIEPEEEEEEEDKEDTRVARIQYAIGSQVEADYQGEGTWYAGVVTRVEPRSDEDGSPLEGGEVVYSVRYNDGDVEDGVEEDRIRLLLHFIKLRRGHKRRKGAPNLRVSVRSVAGLPSTGQASWTYSATVLAVPKLAGARTEEMLKKFDALRDGAKRGQISNTAPKASDDAGKAAWDTDLFYVVAGRAPTLLLARGRARCFCGLMFFLWHVLHFLFWMDFLDYFLWSAALSALAASFSFPVFFVLTCYFPLVSGCLLLSLLFLHLVSSER